MGNRVFLYLATPKGAEHDNFEEVADAKNHVPVLWQILLAQGESAEPVSYQRVFGDAGTPAAAALAVDAIARLEEVLDFVQAHPLARKLPQLPRYVDATKRHLRQMLENWADEEPPVFSANLDELFWLEDSQHSAEAFIESELQAFTETWRQTKHAIATNDYALLDKVFRFSEFHLTAADWDVWNFTFGFGCWQHEYFDYSEIREIDFEAFCLQPQIENDDDYRDDLGHGRYRFHLGDNVGVRDGRDENAAILLPATYESVLNADSDDEDSSILFIEKNGKWGLFDTSETAQGLQGTILLQPSTDEIYDFVEGAALALQDERYGYLSLTGEWICPPVYEDAFEFSEGYAIVMLAGRFGFIDKSGRLVIPTIYDDAENFDERGYACVSAEQAWGVIDTEGKLIVPCLYQSVLWMDVLGGWLIQADDKYGLISADGRPWLDVQYDEILTSFYRYAILVRQKKHFGLLDWQGQILAPAEYGKIELLFPDEDSECPSTEETESPPHLFFLCQRGRKKGILNGLGQLILPCEYKSIEATSITQYGDDYAYLLEEYVIVSRPGQSKGERHLKGVVHLPASQEIIPCVYHAIHPISPSQDPSDIAFLVFKENPETEQALQGKGRHGVLRPNGVWTHQQLYAWIATPRVADEAWGAMLVCEELRRRWQDGKPVKAAHGKLDLYFWLYPDGSVQGHADYLSAEIAKGDLDAAYQLAKNYRTGEGIGANEKLALKYMRLAATAPDASLHMRGPIPDAMYDLAQMLVAGEGGPPDPIKAREWLKKLSKIEGRNNSKTYRLLGYLFLNGQGGRADPEGGLRFYEQAIKEGDAVAAYRAGICFRDGLGCEVNLATALAHFKEAIKGGYVGSAVQAAHCLYCMAQESPEDAEITLLQDESEYYFQKALSEDEQGTNLAYIYYHLGLLRLARDQDSSELQQAADLFLKAAQIGSLEAMQELITRVYGPIASPLHNRGQAEYWSEQYRNAGGPVP